jgi:CDP-paratose 2-epimerase
VAARAHGERVTFAHGECATPPPSRAPCARARATGPVGDVFHFAAQVAVTTSLADPADDFEVNARGTLNVLEAVRAERDASGAEIPVLYTSTNKVYGELSDVAESHSAGGRGRYVPADAELAATGIGERRPLDFHSPYGCSKGTADQYVCDYARSFGLPAVVFRMSCIYGPRQFGTEDQGWVAHFLIRALDGQPVTLYGDGLQVRDVLFVDDLVDAFLLARRHVDALCRGARSTSAAGPPTPRRCSSWWSRIGGCSPRRPTVSFEGLATGDQKWYLSDVRRSAPPPGWQPRTSWARGLAPCTRGSPRPRPGLRPRDAAPAAPTRGARSRGARA